MSDNTGLLCYIFVSTLNQIGTEMKLIIAGCMFFICLSANAADLSVFGFELGKPLLLQDCTFKMVGSIKLYDVIPTTTCVQDAAPVNTYGQPVRRIIFSQSDAPSIVKNWQMIALEVDGNLIGLEFFTLGAVAQDLTLQTLVKKYGKPTKQLVQKVGNSFGASTDAITATWKTKEMNVTFDGISDRIDRGRVLIDLPEGEALRRSWSNATEGAKKAL